MIKVWIKAAVFWRIVWNIGLINSEIKNKIAQTANTPRIPLFG
jgi:hypothetical protein